LVLFDVDTAANVVVDVVIGVIVGVVDFAAKCILYTLKVFFHWWGSKRQSKYPDSRPPSNGPLVGTDRPRPPLNKAKASLISALSHSSLPGRRWRNAGTPFRAARGFVGVLFPSADWIVIP
jgi:hypothetical protein